MNAHPQTHWRCSKACHNFEGRSLILAPNTRQGKCFFCVLVCCPGSTVYLAGRHVKKSDLNRRFYMLRSTFLTPKQLNITKSIHKTPDIFTCRPSKYCEVVQEKISGSNSLQSPSNSLQKCSSSAANCWFKCVGGVFKQKLFSPE